MQINCLKWTLNKIGDVPATVVLNGSALTYTGTVTCPYAASDDGIVAVQGDAGEPVYIAASAIAAVFAGN